MADQPDMSTERRPSLIIYTRCFGRFRSRSWWRELGASAMSVTKQMLLVHQVICWHCSNQSGRWISDDQLSCDRRWSPHLECVCPLL